MKKIILFLFLLSSFVFSQRVEKAIAFNADSLSAGFQVSSNMILGGLLLPQGTCSKVYIDVTNSTGYVAGTWYQLQKGGADYYEDADSTSAFAVSFHPISMKDWAYCRFRLDADPADTINAVYIERKLE